LLGFVEGDGSFSYNKLLGCLSSGLRRKENLSLMYAIRDYLINLAKHDEQSATIYVRFTSNNISELRIEREYLIKELIIPLFSSMHFHSKKQQDFED
jgi:LAGLIDADG endonuclease